MPEPGYWFEYTLLDQSYLIMRGNDGVVRGFVNACRHRGNALCQGQGHSARITCPFHLWQYELDGRLRKISDEKNFGPCDKAALGLIPVQTGVFSGFVFINPDLKAPSLDDYLGDEVKALLEPYRMQELIPLGLNVSQPLAANWKTALESFIEQYHVHAIHAMEESILDFAEGVEHNSRLSCQIKVSDALDGLILRMPESQQR